MAETARPFGTRVLLFTEVTISPAACAGSGWRLHQSVELARLSEPLQRPPSQPSLRLIIGGDSTAVGTGATAFASAAASHRDAVLANLFRESADDPFVQRQELNATDGLHPATRATGCGSAI